MARSSSMAAASGGHVRSASVPCQSHPLLMHVDDQLVALRSWTSNPGQNPLSLAHVRALLCVLDELLNLPIALLHLHRSMDSLLLDGFLILADAFGSFLTILLALRQYASELRAAVRRRDPAKVASAARAQRQVGKELEHLAAAMARDAARCAGTGRASMSSDQIEVVKTVAEAINGTAVASASVFVEVGAVADTAAALAASVFSPATSYSSTSPVPKKKQSLMMTCVNARSNNKQQQMKQQHQACRENEQREAMALKKLHELEQCIGELESESEKVFRSLVQTRVSLLNIHTPTF